MIGITNASGSGLSDSKTIITLTGTSGVLTDEQYALVVNDSLNVELKLNDKIFTFAEDQHTYRTFTNTVFPTTTTKETEVIRINTEEGEEDYKTWAWEQITEPSGTVTWQAITGNIADNTDLYEAISTEWEV